MSLLSDITNELTKGNPADIANFHAAFSLVNVSNIKQTLLDLQNLLSLVDAGRGRSVDKINKLINAINGGDTSVILPTWQDLVVVFDGGRTDLSSIKPL